MEYGPTTPLLGTPQNYQSPEQVKATRDYAKALLSGSGQQPIHHWTQGISNMVSALVGGNLDYTAGQKENESNAVEAGRKLPDLGEGTSVVGTAPLEGTKTASYDGPTPRGIRNNNPLNIEAGDFTKSQPGFTGSDGRFAKFETPEHGVAAASSLLDSYEKRGINTVAGIVGRWAPASDGNDVGSYAKAVAAKLGIDPNAPVPKEMRPQLIAAMGQHENGRPIAFAGPDGAKSPAVQAMGAALRGDPTSADGASVQVAAGGPKPLASPRVGPNGMGIFYEPSLIKPQPRYSEGQMLGILSSPRTSEDAKMKFLEQYRNQNQPITLPWPGGKVIVDPRDPTKQQFIPEGHWGESQIGDIKSPKFYVPNANGGIDRSVINSPAAGPRSDAGPVPGAEPAAAPAGAPPVSPATAQTAAETAPAAPGAPPMAPTGAPVQVASLDPAAGVQEAAISPGAVKPPVPEVTPAAGPVTPLTKMAQAGPPPGVDPQDWEAYQQKKAFDVKTAVDEEGQKKGVDFAMKKYDTLSTQAAAARKQMPNLDYGLALVNDPNIYQGLFSNEVTAWKKLMAAFPGMFGADAATGAAPNEVFNKVISGSILDSMKTALGGLGQVRVAEIDLLKQANASNLNTPAANRALLELSRRAVQSVDHLDEIGQSYISGDAVMDPVTGKELLKANLDRNGEIQPRRGLDVGYDKLARKFVTEHPSLSPDDIKNYQTIFKTGVDPRRPDAAVAPAKAYPVPPGGAINDLKANPGTAAQFDETFGPGAAAKALGKK